MSDTPVIVVTGANRGIGFEIVRQLSRRGARVVLTARKPESGQAALARLKTESLVASFQPLDVLSQDSIANLADFISSQYGTLDVLINNAGIIPESDAEVLRVDLSAVRAALETNTLPPLRLVQALLAPLRKSKAGRIINVSSGMGALSDMGSDHAAYRMSKTALNAVTGMLASALAGENISVNSVCPGWVRTDMGGPNAERDVAQGADTPAWLALDAPKTLTGKFIRDRKVIPW
jgi:NAD(P)-dependent dehydrogenase (short-subunit alcohol dehydrogenase family)